MCVIDHFFSHWPLFTSMLLFYRLPPQSGPRPIWHSGLLAIWLYCWWSVAVPPEEPVGGGTLRRAANYTDFYKAPTKVGKCLPLYKQGRWHRLGFCRCTGTLPSQVGPQVAFHILQTSSAERGCLLWCKTASARCNHNTLCFLLCWMQTGCSTIEQLNKVKAG